MRTQLVVAALTVLAFLLIGSPANATPLPPGATSIPSLFAGSPGALLATYTSPFTSTLGAADFSGTVIEAVYRDAVTSDVDFVYQFHNNAGSGLPIEQMSDSSFAGFLVNAQEDSTVGFGLFTSAGVFPDVADRSSGAGANVAWKFESFEMQPGMTSAILMIKTNAPTFTAGHTSFINEGTVTVGGFAPAETPEPSALVLLGAGIVGLLGFTARRRKG